MIKDWRPMGAKWGRESGKKGECFGPQAEKAANPVNAFTGACTTKTNVSENQRAISANCHWRC